jgi:large subunit ribosomal protein L28
VVKYAAFEKRASDFFQDERKSAMAKCAHCGKTTTFGHNVSFSKRATNRNYLPNLQKVTVIESGRKVRKTLCTKCIRTLGKTKA